MIEHGGCKDLRRCSLYGRFPALESFEINIIRLIGHFILGQVPHRRFLVASHGLLDWLSIRHFGIEDWETSSRVECETKRVVSVSKPRLCFTYGVSHLLMQNQPRQLPRGM